MEHYICTTCGTQFAESAESSKECPVCLDERQYVPASGQQWTTLKDLQRDHRNVFQKKEQDLYGISTTPSLAIGQRALLVRTPTGNVLWDCLTLIDDATVDVINGLGGAGCYCDFASPLLQLHGGMEPGIWRHPGLPARRRPRLGNAPG